MPSPCALDPDGHARRVLEFDKLIDLIVREARTPGGADLLRALVPSSERAEVARRQKLLGEVRGVLAEGVQAWPLDGVHDLRPWLDRARVAGSHLEPLELRRVAQTLAVCTSMRRFLDTHAARLPLLHARTQPLVAHTELTLAIERAVLENGEVADHASPELARIRRRLVTQRQAVLRTLEAHLGRGKPDAETYVTMRGERYVIPVRADAAAARGIVHDRSATGTTLFVEPLDVVDGNNELQGLRDGEGREVLRILQDLTRGLGAESDEVERSLDALEFVDAQHAAACAAASMRAASPQLGAALRLRAARHPLLEARLATQARAVVPLDLAFGDVGALVITGPNTGGKTVALKTVGLLVLMHQTGLQLPLHPDSELPVFERLVADIGDEQSIEAAESTFSSHLRHVRGAIEAAGAGLLALLDEFMAGTDPEEGAAMAKVVLRRLVQRGATTLVTTHLGALKLFAHAEPGIGNASMVFDATSGTPLFRLQPGVPGSSNALATAERLGFDPDLVAAAREERGDNAARIEEVLRSLEAERLRFEAARALAETEVTEARRVREEAATQLAQVAHQRATHLAQARRDVTAIVDEARSRVEATIRSLREAQASREAIRAAKDELDALAESVSAVEAGPVPVLDGEPRPGDLVWIRPLGREGRMEEIQGDDRARVRYGPAVVTVPMRDLELRARAVDTPPEPARGGYQVQDTNPSAALEIDLRGFDRPEALGAMDQFLDRAVLQGLPSVRIVHGKGTGVLRRTIQGYLASHPAVASHRLGEHGEGGSGVTIAKLH